MIFVYVITAIDDGRVAEQTVWSNLEIAHVEFERLIEIYGGANVCLASRAVDKRPEEIIA